MKKNIIMKNTTVNNIVPPANANANSTPSANIGIPIYCIKNGTSTV